MEAGIAASGVSEHQLRLLAWFSPSYPVGAFAYSHGLEWAQEAGQIVDADGLRAWLTDLVEHGAGRQDSILLAASWRAVMEDDWAALASVAELALAMASSSERRMETVTQGNAFILASRAAHDCAAFDAFAAAWDEDVPYPVAVAVAGAGHRVPLEELLPAFGLGFVANLVSAAVRLGILGQTDGQKVLAALMPAVAALARAARHSGLDDLGACAFRSDVASLRHETQYSRLFRS
jgi:urease accessory protein